MRLNHYLYEAKEMLKDWQNYIKSNKELAIAVDILKIINSKGFKAYIVGGAVRDIILGDDPGDFDIATNCPPEVLTKMFKLHSVGSGGDFGIWIVNHKGFSFEIAQMRSDGKYSDGRRPEKVSFNVTLETDLSRRDITINAMAIDKDGRIIDKFGGKKDIQNKILRTVGDPNKRFGEDYLRMMRTARFSAKLGFDIDKPTAKAIKKLSSNIKELSPERIRDEIMKSAKSDGSKFAKYIITLDNLGILKHILPEIVNLKWFRENLKHHPETRGHGGTVFAHTIEAIKKIGVDQPITMLATLLHDIGKGVTFSQEEGLPRYLGHAQMSIKLTNHIAKRLRMNTKEKNAIIFAVGNHMKFHKILDMKPSKIAKLVADDNWEVLVAVAKADETSRGDAFMHAGEFEKIVDKAVKVKEMVGSKELERRLKLVDGHNVMALTGLKPSKAVGTIIRKVTTWILDNNIQDSKEIEDKIIEVYKEM